MSYISFQNINEIYVCIYIYSPGHLQHHIREKHPDVIRQIDIQQASNKLANANEDFESAMTDCVVHVHIPFNIVEDAYLRKLIVAIESNPNANFVS